MFELPNGYEMKTTFWEDFSIADKFGKAAIIETYEKAISEWKTDIEYITELVIVLNYKIWQYYESGNDELTELYDGLWKKADKFVFDNFKDKDIKYFLEITD